MDEDAGYKYTMEYYSATKKSEMMLSAATGTDTEIVVLSEESQRHIHAITYLESTKMIRVNLLTKHKQTSRRREHTYG